jgi:hypothetical protein
MKQMKQKLDKMKQKLDAAYPGGFAAGAPMAPPGRRIVIAYGSAKFASGGPNEVSVPWPRSGLAAKPPHEPSV